MNPPRFTTCGQHGGLPAHTNLNHAVLRNLLSALYFEMCLVEPCVHLANDSLRQPQQEARAPHDADARQARERGPGNPTSLRQDREEHKLPEHAEPSECLILRNMPCRTLCPSRPRRRGAS